MTQESNKQSRVHPDVLLFIVAGVLYLLGVWFHIPYGGGHIYSDIVSVFQNRLDNSYFSIQNLPFVNTFVEYPPITSYFMYSMGALAKLVPLSLPPNLMGDYYRYTTVFLVIPTFLLISELFKICDILGIKRKNRRTLLYYVATPSFIFMLLLNWYIIGVYFATYGLRKFLQGSRWTSGMLFGLSAGANLVTAAPAFGLFLSAYTWKERINFAIAGGATFLALNLPFIILNPGMWASFWTYHENWYIEGSWMLTFLNNLSSLRHLIFPLLFTILALAVVEKSPDLKKRALTQRDKAHLAVQLSWFLTFAFLFSTYVFTPQMNLILLPFFVIAPIVKRYWEFLAFDIVNSLVIVYGFSQPLLIFGITLNPVHFGAVWQSQVQALAVIRSFWVGKFLLYDGFVKMRKFPERELDTKEMILPSS